ncbi:MAG: hypothetical protein C5B56_10020 [Proteobacteria bacterium]|nr:MAG: hypothetical protein C5B56_10020 [Pseudomonadota bacterium]
MFPITSRYYNIPTGKYEAPDGRTIVYLTRRIVPPPERFNTLLLHTVVDGQRLDQIASQFLGDPEQFWRIADANNAMQPEDLTGTPGSTIRITLPEGIPGIQNA